MSLTKFKNTLINVPSVDINRFDLLGAEAPAQAEAPKTCTPFFISVMIFSPEAGFKYFVKVQKSCSAKNDPIWKLHFDLERLIVCVQGSGRAAARMRASSLIPE
jgi:hypothetical protein